MSLAAVMRAPEESWMALILRPFLPITLPIKLWEIRRRIEEEGVVALGEVGVVGLLETS